VVVELLGRHLSGGDCALIENGESLNELRQSLRFRLYEVFRKCDERAYARPQREGILDKRAAMGDLTSLGLLLIGCRWRRAG
jgi:hypothetical protein